MAELCGVYGIYNKQSDKWYVGSSKNIQVRFRSHRGRLNRNQHHNPYLQNSWNKHGGQPFEFEILEECPKDELIEREQHWMDKKNVMNEGYNIRPRANETELSEETKQKISESLKEYEISEDHRESLSKAMAGRKMSEEAKKKISNAMKGENNHRYGKEPSPETRRKMSESHKGENNHFYGKTHSDESKRKMSTAKKGKNNPNYGGVSEEHRKNISKSKQGSNHPGAKLNEQSVKVIKYYLENRDKTQKKLGDVHNVNQPTISMIKHGKLWSHVSI